MSETKDTSVIPKGVYCYNKDGVCPYWSLREDKPHRRNGYCSFLEQGDWEVDIPNLPEELAPTMSLLWDKVKECDI